MRHGTTSFFAALNYDTGEVVGSLRRHQGTQEFQQFLEQLDATVPPDLAVHLVLEHYTTHKSPPIQRWLLRHPRFTLHIIPTGPDLEPDIRTWLATWNAHPRPYVWVKTADQILASLKSYCQRINGSGH